MNKFTNQIIDQTKIKELENKKWWKRVWKYLKYGGLIGNSVCIGLAIEFNSRTINIIAFTVSLIAIFIEFKNDISLELIEKEIEQQKKKTKSK